MLLVTSTVDGLVGPHSFAGNAVETVLVLTGITLGGNVRHSMRFRDPGIPYQLSGGPLAIRGPELPVLTLEAGSEFLLEEDVNIFVGTNLDPLEAGGLRVEGTETNPVTFEAVDPALPWGEMRIFSEHLRTTLTWAELRNGGGPVGSGEATIRLDDGGLRLENVLVAGSANTGLYSPGVDGFVEIIGGAFENNETGLFLDRALARIRGTRISGNTVGLRTDRLDGECVDAVGVDWGASNGPAHTVEGDSACSPGNAGSGDSVDDGVWYRPFAGASTLGFLIPRQSWVLADGVRESEVVVRLFSATGAPLAGLSVELQTTLGEVVQPREVTNADGATIGWVRSPEAGRARISATVNGDPVAALAEVRFWDPGFDT
ncbi:MAG: Ig-like domain-containing protein, partial [Myxococcota bacterium]